MLTTVLVSLSIYAALVGVLGALWCRFDRMLKRKEQDMRIQTRLETYAKLYDREGD